MKTKLPPDVRCSLWAMRRMCRYLEFLSDPDRRFIIAKMESEMGRPQYVAERFREPSEKERDGSEEGT